MIVFWKTLREKKMMILFWCLAVAAINLLLIQIFPPMKEAFSGMSANLPPSLAEWFGDGAIWDSLKGFIGLEVMNQMSLVAMIFAIVFALGIFASEEQSGLLLTQLAKPLSRRSYFWQKYFALAFAVIIFVAFYYAGTYAGIFILGDNSVGLIDLWQPAIATFLLCLSIGSIAFALAAIYPSRAIAGIVAGAAGIIGYFLSSMSETAEIVKNIAYFTPFYYYNTPNVIENGLNVWNILILLAVALIPTVFSSLVFARRDLKNR